MDVLIEEGIRPLVDALNELDFADTVYSCEGHFGRPQNELFLPTAYVTFGVNDVRKFRHLHGCILEINDSNGTAALQLSYDCLLGRFTLSIWPDVSSKESYRKRSIVDSVVSQLAAAIRNSNGSETSLKPDNGGDSRGALPCGEPIPPCMLVIPAKQLICPFIISPEGESENLR